MFFEDFPGGPVVKNLPANSRNMGSVPNPGTININKTPQLSLCAIAIEPVLRVREPKVLSPHVATTEARVPRARAPQQEKPPQ